VCAGEDGDARGVVGVEGAQGVGQQVGGGAIDGVLALGAIDRDDGDVSVALDVDAHRGLTSVCASSSA
jgi:hypothetical protein